MPRKQRTTRKSIPYVTKSKIVSMKSLQENKNLYVKAIVKKLYGTEVRPVVILFEESVPLKAHCRCPVRLSGLCCHVLELLLFLKHFHGTKEKLLN